VLHVRTPWTGRAGLGVRGRTVDSINTIHLDLTRDIWK
jgi:hypothetical protein